MVIQMALKQGGLTNVQGSVLDFGMNELENFKGAEAVDSKSFTISGSKILYLIKLLSPPHKDIKTGTKCRGYFRMIIKLHSMSLNVQEDSSVILPEQCSYHPICC